jgi:two-component system, LuxR family, response regulator FixJ
MIQTNTVFIIDDEAALCRSIQWLLESVNLKVETYTSARSYLDKYDPKKSGCILLDIRMPDMSGLEVQKELKTRGNTLPVIIMSGHGDITTAVRAMKAGAVDFITKPFNDQILIELIQETLNNVPPQYLQEEFRRRFASLTTREIEVMECMVLGKLSKIIADELKISPKTVEFYRANVMKKMGARNLAALVKMNILKSCCV